MQVRDGEELKNERGDGSKVLQGHLELTKNFEQLSRLKSKQLKSLLAEVTKVSPTDFSSLPFASIHRAKVESSSAETSYREKNTQIETAWQAYPSTPRDDRKKFNLDDEYWNLVNPQNDDSLHVDPNLNADRANNAIRKHTAASKAKMEWATSVGEVPIPGGAGNFYRQVNVCGECCRAYMLLDKAREIMFKDKQDEDMVKRIIQGTDGDKDVPGALSKTTNRRRQGRDEADTRMRTAAGIPAESSFATETSDFNDSQVLFSPSDKAPQNKRGFPGPSGLEFDSTTTADPSDLRPLTSPNPKRQNTGAGGARPLTSPNPALFQDSLESDVAFNDPSYEKIPRRRTTTIKQKPGSPSRPTWKGRQKQRARLEQEAADRGEAPPKQEAFDGHFEKLDKFLRGTGEEFGNKNARRADELKSVADSTFISEAKSRANAGVYHAKVLVAMNDMSEAEPIMLALEEQGYLVAFEHDGITVMEILIQGSYDALIVQEDLFVKSAKEITFNVRDRERAERKKLTRTMASNARSRNQMSVLGGPESAPDKPDATHPNQVKSLPIVVYTGKVAPKDLKGYMEAGMDGCLSRPYDEDALITTMRQAVPDHLKPKEVAPEEEKGSRFRQKQFMLNAQAQGTGSSDMVKKTLAMSSSFTNNEGCAYGVLQYDADTVFPYTVMDSTLGAAGQQGAAKATGAVFNLVVVHDLFDTCERMKIFLRPLAQRYPGLQILLWNYPGQAFTEYREEQLLNNEYHAQCLDGLLQHVGPQGTGQFNTDKPFHLLGYGNGGNIASFYSAFYPNKALRSLVLMNSFSYVDPHMASVLHDCMNVFSCSPPNRPDLPIYFFARFLFSPSYLSSVSTPLALNLYTAVHNPIALKGRIQLCLGALSHIDLRNSLKEIPVAIIQVQSTQDALVRPLHTEPYINKRDGEVKSIHRCLAAHVGNSKARKTCLVWVNSGHEVFQEKRNQSLQLIEQLVTGYHEGQDVAFMPAMSVDRDAAMEMRGDYKNSVATLEGGGGRKALSTMETNQSESFEDSFVNSITGKLASLNGNRAKMVKKYDANADIDREKENWDSFAINMAKEMKPGGAKNGGTVGKRVSKYSSVGGVSAPDGVVRIVTDPTQAAFEKNAKVVYGFKKNPEQGLYKDAENFPEVQEYMGWRLKRNKKRLSRLDAAVRIIQGSFRAHLAWQIITKLKHERAACYIQRCYRGWRGRIEFLDRMRLMWAAQLVQRNFRGHAGREAFLKTRVQSAAVTHIQRVLRGHIARVIVNKLHYARRRGASAMQSTWRKRQARSKSFEMRVKRNASQTLQRLYRGHLGRRRCAVERDKYLFSKSQSQGIAFGRQMLLEHKLHATKLQSEVSVLTQEKVRIEEHIESLLDEISEFEEGVKTLEKEMHQLSKIQTEAAGVLDEESKIELREQKIRLDAEFSSMLSNISDRKENLMRLQENMVLLDRSRQQKEEELRVLERKLVVLLEEQQNELESIRRRQERKGEALLEGETSKLAVATGGGGGFQGPTAKDKQQAAQLMESTETLMKFGFMSMSMTYFSSLNMVKAMRTVAATDTVMGALHANASQGGGGGGAGLGATGFDGGIDSSNGEVGSGFKPELKPGKMPGQGDIRVSAWSVTDVAGWLVTISLGQYRTSFSDAAVDGAFLFDINDDDLKNTLGVEHRLHRKKILNTIGRLKESENARDREMILSEMADRNPPPGFSGPAAGYPNGPVGPALGVGGFVAPGSQVMDQIMAAGGPGALGGAVGAQTSAADSIDVYEGAVDLDINLMSSWVRHNKLKKLTKCLEQLAPKLFDKSLTNVQYVEMYGTQYSDAYEREGFNLNQTLEHGNTLVHVAAQNGSVKIAKLLQRYGANLNHQNHIGQTCGHFAIAYTFYDFSAWLFDPDGGGADDLLLNIHGLGAYDGLEGDDEDEKKASEDAEEMKKTVKAIKYG